MGVLSLRDIMSLRVFHNALGLDQFVFGNKLRIWFRFTPLYLLVYVLRRAGSFSSYLCMTSLARRVVISSYRQFNNWTLANKWQVTFYIKSGVGRLGLLTSERTLFALTNVSLSELVRTEKQQGIFENHICLEWNVYFYPLKTKNKFTWFILVLCFDFWQTFVELRGSSTKVCQKSKQQSNNRIS